MVGTIIYYTGDRCSGGNCLLHGSWLSSNPYCPGCSSDTPTNYGQNDNPNPAPIGGVKHDQDKPRLDLLPSDSLIEIAKVLNFGAKKYSAENWRKGINYSRLSGAAMRHLLAWKDGENLDPESGLTHLAHAGCCILFLLWMEKHRQDLDDRFKLETKESENGNT